MTLEAAVSGHGIALARPSLAAPLLRVLETCALRTTLVPYSSIGAGSAAAWLRGSPRFLASERWISGSLYIGLGVAAALSSNQRK